MQLNLGRKAAALAVAGVVMAGAGAVAWADSNGGSSAAPVAPSNAPATTPPVKGAGQAAGGKGTAAGKAAGGGGLGILRAADHGDVDIKVKATGAWQTVTFDRGQVTDVAADHITLARPDGKSVTLTISASTRYRGVTSWQTVTKSKGAVVISANGSATAIMQRA